MSRERPYTSVDVVSERDNNTLETTLGGEYQLPHPMIHILEVKEWISLFRPDPVYTKVEDRLTDLTTSVMGGDVAVCENCHTQSQVGFSDYTEYFSDEEYERVLKLTNACSLDCAIEFIFRGEFAPNVEEFKSDPESYKTFGLSNYTLEEIETEYYGLPKMSER